jgi:hypothetical protein
MSRWLKHHEGPMYRVVIHNHVSKSDTYYGPYSLLKTARGVLTNEIGSYWNKLREEPNTGFIEETETNWHRNDG